MAADTTAIRRWLLDEARSLQEQQETIRVRLTVLRTIMRLFASHDGTPAPPIEEASS